MNVLNYLVYYFNITIKEIQIESTSDKGYSQAIDECEIVFDPGECVHL